MESRTILVTGGNRGIGLETVKGLAKNSDDTILMGSRSVAAGEEESRKIGKNVKPVEVNLSQRETLVRNIASITEQYGRVDVLVNNAAILNRAAFLEISSSELDEAIRVNLMGAFELTQALVPGMIKNGYGRIVNMSSGWGAFDQGLAGPFSYALTKAALNALTKTIANELPPQVKINAICPGWVKTRMGGEGAPRSPAEGADTAIWLANLPDDGPTGGFFKDRHPIGW